MSASTVEEGAEAEGTSVMMVVVLGFDLGRPRALPVPVRFIVLRGDDDEICYSNHRLTHLEQKQE